jgi:4-diphosphocytidyl-2-C-methyl-D-erythritol kinase
VKEKLYSLGATYACMSGSGATVFGIFEKEFNAAVEFADMTVWSKYLE